MTSLLSRLITAEQALRKQVYKLTLLSSTNIKDEIIDLANRVSDQLDSAGLNTIQFCFGHYTTFISVGPEIRIHVRDDMRTIRVRLTKVARYWSLQVQNTETQEADLKIVHELLTELLQPMEG